MSSHQKSLKIAVVTEPQYEATDKDPYQEEDVKSTAPSHPRSAAQNHSPSSSPSNCKHASCHETSSQLPAGNTPHHRRKITMDQLSTCGCCCRGMRKRSGQKVDTAGNREQSKQARSSSDPSSHSRCSSSHGSDDDDDDDDDDEPLLACYCCCMVPGQFFQCCPDYPPKTGRDGSPICCCVVPGQPSERFLRCGPAGKAFRDGPPACCRLVLPRCCRVPTSSLPCSERPVRWHRIEKEAAFRRQPPIESGICCYSVDDGPPCCMMMPACCCPYPDARSSSRPSPPLPQVRCCAPPPVCNECGHPIARAVPPCLLDRGRTTLPPYCTMGPRSPMDPTYTVPPGELLHSRSSADQDRASIPCSMPPPPCCIMRDPQFVLRYGPPPQFPVCCVLPPGGVISKCDCEKCRSPASIGRCPAMSRPCPAEQGPPPCCTMGRSPPASQDPTSGAQPGAQHQSRSPPDQGRTGIPCCCTMTSPCCAMPPKPPRYQDLASRATPEEHVVNESEGAPSPSHSSHTDDPASSSACTLASCDVQNSLNIPTKSTNSGTSPAPTVPSNKPEQSLKRKSAQSTSDAPPAKSATLEQTSKWKFAADKRRVNPRMVGTHGKTDTGLPTDRITSAKPPPIITTTNFTSATTTTPDTATSAKQSRLSAKEAPPATADSSGATALRTNVFTGLSSAITSKDLPNFAIDLARLCAHLRPPQQAAATPAIPSGEELKQLVDAIASIEHDVRAMASALQPDTTTSATAMASDDTGLTRSSSFTVLDQSALLTSPDVVLGGTGPGKTAATAAVALLMPATVQQTGKAKDPSKDLTKGASKSPKDSKIPKDFPSSPMEQKVPDTHQTTHMPAPSACQRMIPKETRGAGAHPGRVKVLPPAPHDNRVVSGTGGKQWDYSKYSLLPAARSRLPFRLATQSADAATKEKTRTASESSDATDTPPSGRQLPTPSDHPDTEDSTTKPQQFTGIQQIIRHLESIGTASAPTTVSTPAVGTKPKHQQAWPVDAMKPATTTAVETVMTEADVESGATMLRSAGTSPIDFVQILSTKETQTTPKSSIKLAQDDKNMNKSRSLEYQQQQQDNSTGVVMPPRSSGPAVTHLNAIPLPAPASAAAASSEQESSDQDSTSGKEKGSDRKRIKTTTV